MSKHIYTDELYEFCVTDQHRLFLSLAIEGMPKKRIAEELGVNERRTRKIGEAIRKNAIRHGWREPDSGDLRTPTQPIPVKGESTLYGPEGEAKLRWVKTDKSTAQMIEEAREVVDAMMETIPAATPVKLLYPNMNRGDDLMNLFTLTDAHIGMYAWHEETGDNWSTDIAEEFFRKWFDYSIARAPIAKTATLSVLGDFFHYDGKQPVTPASKHVLDADSRMAMMIRIGVRLLRYFIMRLLETYEHVNVVMSEGNHDESLVVATREMFVQFYDNEPRLFIDPAPTMYHALEWGLTSLYFHHGHKRTAKRNLDKTFAGMFHEIFGRTKYRYAHTGHFHSEKSDESELMLITQHRTLAGHDAYSTGAGYLSERSSTVITYSKKFGRVSSFEINPAILEAYE